MRYKASRWISAVVIVSFLFIPVQASADGNTYAALLPEETSLQLSDGGEITVYKDDTLQAQRSSSIPIENAIIYNNDLTITPNTVKDEDDLNSMEQSQIDLEESSLELFDRDALEDRVLTKADEILDSESIMAAAAQPGIIDFYATVSQPIPINQYIGYYFSISNPMSTASATLILHIYFDDVYCGSLNIGSFPANSFGYATFDVAVGDPGYGTISISLQHGSTIVSTRSQTYLYGSGASTGSDFEVVSISHNAPSNAIGPTDVVYSIVMKNNGPQSITGFTFTAKVAIGGLIRDEQMQTVSVTVPSGYNVSITRTLEVPPWGTEGNNVFFEFQATPTGASDPYLSNNSKQNNTAYVYSYPFFGVSWNRPSVNLQVKVNAAVEDYYGGIEVCQAEITKWNGISSNISFQVSAGNSPSGAAVFVGRDDMQGQVYGFCNTYNGSMQIMGDALYSTYVPTTRCEVYITNYGMMNGTLAGMKRVLVHEFGHVLGLGHIYDSSTSTVMREKYSTQFLGTPSAFDVGNIKSKYGQ